MSDHNLPKVYYGSVENSIKPGPLTEAEDIDPDDEELAETPPGVIALLGFDPKTDPDYLAASGEPEPAPERQTAGDADAWEYFEGDGSTYARPANPGRAGGVTHILHGKEWAPYTGNRLYAFLYSQPLKAAPEGIAPPAI